MYRGGSFLAIHTDHHYRLGRLARRAAILAVCKVFILGAWGHTDPAAASSPEIRAASLQKMLDAAKPGEAVTLPPGQYAEAIVISKRLVVQAEGVTLTGSGGDAPVVKLEAEGAELHGMAVEKEAAGEAPAVLISADRVMVDGLRIKSRSYGIQLRKSDGSTIRSSIVAPTDDLKGKSARQTDKRNGIDLFQSNGNVIQENRVTDMFDGIYMESSHDNTVLSNEIDHSRYGIHCMYTNGTIMRGNSGEYNVTGIMAMIVKGAEVTGNVFTRQKGSVNSQGMLFFDVQNTRVTGNELTGNRVGLYIEMSRNNVWEDNDVSYNFVGIQLLDSQSNRLESNRFVSNVIETQADGSKDNELLHNYWDAFQGLDPSGDGISDIPYAMNPFFQRLTKGIPAYQIFFQSPGMRFLESLFTADAEQWTQDREPRMEPSLPSIASSDRRTDPWRVETGIAGAALLVAALMIITLMGVKKS
ncbi:right-handed parallel beta-helix repeat-containing protein [Paenibacillus sp. D51F]